MGIYDRDYYADETPRGLTPSWDQRSAVSIIIIACVGVFLANMIFSSRNWQLMDQLQLNSDEWQRPWMLWRLLTYGFAHDASQIGHIFWNMFGLWLLGRTVEERYGRSEFWRIYLISIVFCGAVWLARNYFSGANAALVGASGAVCCIQMLFVFNFPKVILLVWGIIPVPAWVLGILLVAGNLFVQPSADVGPDAAPQIAYDVHLAGIGLAAAYYFLHWNFSALSSPTQFLRTLRKKWSAPRLRVHAPESVNLRDEEEADRILSKIHEQGQDSLTSRERKFMEKYSRRVRQKREQSSD